MRSTAGLRAGLQGVGRRWCPQPSARSALVLDLDAASRAAPQPAQVSSRGVHARASDDRRGGARFLRDPSRRGPADSVSPQDPHREESGLHRLPRERRQGADRRHPERQDLHDLPQPDRHRQAADQAGHRLCRQGGRDPVAARLRLHARGARPLQPRAAHPRQRRLRDLPRRPRAPDGRRAHRRSQHGVLRELPSRRRTRRTTADLSFRLGAGPSLDGSTPNGSTSSSSPRSPARAPRWRAAAIPEHQLIRFVPDEDARARRRGVEAERVPDVRRRLRRQRARDGGRRRDDAQRPGRRRARWRWRRSSRATPKDPVSQGGLCARGQASIQITYHPDRPDAADEAQRRARHRCVQADHAGTRRSAS